MEMLLELVKRNRSYRRFYQEVAINIVTLENLVNLARLSASAGNKQPLKYVLSNEPKRNQAIFETLAWAAYLTDWKGPPEGERPSGYIVVLEDTRISHSSAIDAGIACQSMLLGAIEAGLGGCILVSINREKLRSLLGIPEYYQILLVIALGKPRETVVIEEVRDGEIKYWRDDNGIHHVPKRSLEELILPI